MLGGVGGSDDDDDDDKTEDSDLDEPGWRITREMMDRMDSSDWLRSELGDGSLRRMMFEIGEADIEASRSRGGGRVRRGAVILGFERETKLDAEGLTVRFEGVDSSVATLKVSAYDAEVPLGSGAGHDVALLCKFNLMKPAGNAVMMIDVSIVPDKSMAALDAVTDKKATMAVNSTLGNRSPLKESP